MCTGSSVWGLRPGRQPWPATPSSTATRITSTPVWPRPALHLAATGPNHLLAATPGDSTTLPTAGIRSATPATLLLCPEQPPSPLLDHVELLKLYEQPVGTLLPEHVEFFELDEQSLPPPPSLLAGRPQAGQAVTRAVLDPASSMSLNIYETISCDNPASENITSENFTSEKNNLGQ